MAWPTAGEYFEAVQNPALCFLDDELRQGQTACNSQGLPILYSGNFASVFRIDLPGGHRSCAIKCFTRKSARREERYRHISAHLQRVALPFMVPFVYLEKGIRIGPEWYPILKMEWVAGQTLNQFVAERLDKPALLKTLAEMWVKVAQRLSEAQIAHADLQHGNVLLVPNPDGNSLRLTLVDYDGMIVPALAQQPSGEVGHPAFQHPERLQKGLYKPEVDRFSHLVICCGLQCLAVAGKSLWDRYDNGDNLLFRKEDFADPAESRLFRELWKLPGPSIHALVANLIQACTGSMAHVPAIYESLYDEKVLTPLSAEQNMKAEKIMATATAKPRAENASPWWISYVEKSGGNSPLVAAPPLQTGPVSPATDENLENEAAKIIFSTSIKTEEDIVWATPQGPEIDFVCPFCNEAYQVSEDLAGKKIKCRHCRQPCWVDAKPVPPPDLDKGFEYGFDLIIWVGFFILVFVMMIVFCLIRLSRA